MRFTATDWGKEENVKKLKDSCLAPEQLELKVGAQVMLLKNQTSTLGNE